MFEYFDAETNGQLIQSSIIAAVGLALFFGLKGRILRFAEWARLPRLALTPVRIGIRYAILIVTVLLILSRWGFQINGIIAVIGTVLGLVAIGFVAVWSVLSNFLCTLVLVVLKPFYVGDEIELPTANVRGKVVDLSLVYTTLESGPGETVLVPNNMFFQLIYKRRHGSVRTELENQLGQSAPAALRSSAG
jgi:small-conductance mechanosensitive channel